MNPHPVHHGSAVLHHFTAGHKQQLEIRGERQGEEESAEKIVAPQRHREHRVSESD